MSGVNHELAAQGPVDLLVVGAGACGLIGALAAAEAGAQVLVLEAAPPARSRGAVGRAGGEASNTERSTGLVPAAGTRFQREVGIDDDTAGRMVEDLLAKNHHSSDLAMTRLLCELAGPTVEWLADLGVPMGCATDFTYPGHSRLRMHGPPSGYGASLLSALEEAVGERPGISVRRGVRVSALLTEDEAVVGVRVGAAEVPAGAVLLALNGFGGDPAMVREHLGEQAAGALYFGSPANTGDGIKWGVELGAATAQMGSYQGHASVAEPDGPLVTWGVVVNGAVLVGSDGRRFGDEMVGYSEFAAAVLAQPGGRAWEIFDQRVHDASRGTRLEEVIDAGKVDHHATLADLAADTGLDEAGLVRTLEEIARCAGGVVPDRFARTAFAEGGLRPPYYSIAVRGALFHTQGGLVINEHAQVLRADGSPIAGLYAGGGTAVGVSGSGSAGYSSGNGLLAAAVLGRLAGEDAARRPHPDQN